jgi:hypothetical protein
LATVADGGGAPADELMDGGVLTVKISGDGSVSMSNL